MKITDFGYNGEGVGHIDGKVCFVPYTIVGEEVEVDRVKETSSFIKCKVKEVPTPSEKREVAPCPYFTKCGGCDFQHLGYQDELALKKEILSRHFAKLGYDGDIVVHPSDEPYGYRNKIKLFVGEHKLGLNRAGSDKVVDIDKCLLVDQQLNETLQKINNFVVSMKLGKSIENVILRKEQGQAFVWFIFKREVEVDFKWLSFILGDNHSIFVSVDKAEPVCVLGDEVFRVTEFDLKCEYSVDSFHQVNDKVYKELYLAATQNIVGDNILNAYSGGGVLSGLIAKSGKNVYGVELGSAEHEAAERLKECNGLATLTNIQGDCAKVLPELEVQFDTILIDPPRAGCAKEVCEALNSSKAKRVIYISCNPATLIRDLQQLSSYRLEKVELFDMFPRTANFETLVVLNLKP